MLKLIGKLVAQCKYLKRLAIFLYMKEGSLLIKKIKSKIAAEPSFSFKLAEKVEKLVLLWQKYLAAGAGL